MKDYYIGLDMGTDSIGWAVTDPDYNILKFRGNAMWGIRLLEESNTADERRAFRSGRKRTQRIKFRQQCLEMLFDEEISKKDIAFFSRLKESNLYLEDKSVECKYSVFNDKEYTDKDFHKEYPTVYHLRRELIRNKEPHDIRLVYLAVSHIIKNRGHFLFDSDLGGDDSLFSFRNVWDELNFYLRDNYEFEFDCADTQPLEEILKNNSLTKTRKKQQALNILSVERKTDKEFYDRKAAVITLLTGGTASAANLYSNEEYKNCECKNICISSGFDENESLYESVFGEKTELLLKIKAVYDWAVLADILKGEKYISFAKVRDYEKHKSDLALLKQFVKKYCTKDIYDRIFNENKKGVCNYLAYSRHSAPSPEETNCSREKFCEFLKKTLPKDCPDAEYSFMYEEIEACSFLPKAKSTDNSVIPIQVTKTELQAILRNAQEYFDFLNKKNEDGKTVSEMIMDIFSFRIPYYVGPLNRHSDKSWLERTDEKIYPWNFSKVVDTDKSAEKFIENLTSKCTYLPREDVIPKNSLLYSTFTVLNELNNLKVDGEEISVADKQKIYNELFLKRNKVTQKSLRTLLGKDIVISGIDGDFKSSLKSYRDLEFLSLSDSDKEEIIKAITIFGDDKKLLKKRLQKKFGDVLTQDEIKAVCRLKYTGWSRLSRKFLVGIEGVLGSTGEVINIIRAMWETNDNLMQLLSNKNTFIEKIDEENSGELYNSLRDEIDSLYVSPKVKRPIFQTMQIIKEIVKIQGCEPKKIFVEMARGPEENRQGRTKSRKDRLIELYKNCKDQEKELYELLQTYDENDFRRDALYLYFTQFGRCMYSGNPIRLDDLFNKSIYDIDHIFPQSKIKDDSLDNRVLVLKTENEIKGNIYPVKENIRNKMQDFWKMLLAKELITRKKYDRLVRTTPLTDEELSSFIARQIVETRQSTKAIAQLLSNIYKNTETVYVKAGYVSDFRQKFDFVKSRDVNDLHHAKDAYLNIVVGNVYNTQFNHNKLFYVKALQKGEVSLNKMFFYPVDGAWKMGTDSSISTVRRVMSKNNIRFTRYSYKQQGGLFDQNILKKGNGQVPVKANSPRSDISKYGGYNRAASSYFSIVRYDDKKGSHMQMVPVDLYREKEYAENPQKYMSELLGIPDVEIAVPCVKYNTLISVNGFRMHISSKSSGGATYVCKPAVQLVLGAKQEKYVKAISRYLAKCQELGKVKEITSFDCLSREENTELYDCISEKLLNTVFKLKFERLGNILVEKRPVFEALSVNEQCSVLMEILNILHANVRTGDLTLIGEAKKSGVSSVGCKIDKSKTLHSFKLIYQSITGLFEKETELIK